MQRRDFIKKVGLASAGAFAVPYILPSGRLFAASGVRKANHVVFCLYAGGIRNIESVKQAEGNLMPYSLSGSATIAADIAGSMTPLPLPSGQPLQKYGTLFKEFRYKEGPTGHFNGHMTAMTGVYTQTDLDLKQHPENPTVFEFYRKHNSPSQTALNAWWVSNALGPYPALNYSRDTNYGALYGANYIQPGSIISQAGYNALHDPKTFTATEKNKANALRKFFDNNFNKTFLDGDAGVTNGLTDTESVQNFITTSFTEAYAGQYNNPWGTGFMTNDMFNMFFAEKIIQKYKPELMVVNMQDVDIGHSDFTGYCNALRMADYSVAHLWNTIQNTPGMANDTILIIAPEIGRNLAVNNLVDANGRYALDHNSDNTSREIFCMILGPSGVVKQDQVINTVEGETIDIVPTIADILGFYDEIPALYKSRMGSALTQAFV